LDLPWGFPRGFPVFPLPVIMKNKNLINILQKLNPDDEVVFYLKNKNELEEKNLETILDTDLGVEITLE